MLTAGFDQLRFVLSLIFGIPFSPRSLERLVSAINHTIEEFGDLSPQGAELIGGPVLDEESRREMQWRRFKQQAKRATDTDFYAELFNQLKLDPTQLGQSDIQRVPITPKEAVRANPDAFVRHSGQPFMRTTTTGTTGQPTTIYFSQREFRVFFALTAMSSLYSKELVAEDIAQISTAGRGTLGNVCFAGACAHIGAVVYLAGIMPPEQCLKLLAEKRNIRGKKPRTSVLYSYPSYLGQLVDYGLRLGYKPSDFGLERLLIGGEILTDGLKRRAEELFGEARVSEGYGITELWPFGGRMCEEGHLHFEISHGLLEIINPETSAPARPGEWGTIVGTPFMPFRETTIVLRYDTQDVVRVPAEPLKCSLRHLPATSRLIGKLALSAQYEDGRVFPRQVMEALESCPDVPLPARFGFWAVPGGVEIEVVARSGDLSVRREIEAALEKQQVPVRKLTIVTDMNALQRPFPLRGDLQEVMFTPSQHGISEQLSLK